MNSFIKLWHQTSARFAALFVWILIDQVRNGINSKMFEMLLIFNIVFREMTIKPMFSQYMFLLLLASGECKTVLHNHCHDCKFCNRSCAHQNGICFKCWYLSNSLHRSYRSVLNMKMLSSNLAGAFLNKIAKFLVFLMTWSNLLSFQKFLKLFYHIVFNVK